MPALREETSRSRRAASILALLTAGSVWLSAGILQGGGTTRIAALPSLWIFALLAVAFVAAAWIARLRLEHAWPLVISLVLWLPFLPIDVPAPFLLWEGPIEGLVWLTVIVGVVTAWASEKAPTASRSVLADPAVAPWIAALVLAALSFGVFSQVRDVIPGGDEPHYLAATQSLLQDADLRVANNYTQGDYLEYFPGRLEPHFLKRATSGEIYSIHSPGVSLIVLPAFAVAGYRGAVVTLVLIAAVTAAMTWRLAYRISRSSAGAWVSVVGVFATAPYFFHTFTIYPEVIGSFCVVCGLWLLIELADLSPVASAKGDRAGVSTRALIAVGVALAILPWLHSRFAVLAAILGVLIVARLAARPAAVSRIAAFLSVPVFAGIAWFAYFYVIWGTPSPAAPYGPDTNTSVSYVMRGLIGLLFDQQFGVMTTAPIYLAAIAGGVLLFRTRPRLAIEMLLIVVPYVMTAASFAMWWAGSAAPARFLVAILPLAAIPIAMIFSGTTRDAGAPTSETHSSRVPVLTVLLLTVSVALILPRAFEDSGRFIYNSRSGVDATLRWLAPGVDLPAALPSVHRSGGFVAVRDAATWIAALVLTGVFARLIAGRWSTGARYAFTALLMAVAAMSSARVAWALDRFSPYGLRPELAALDRFRPSWQTTIVDLQSRSWKDTAGFLDRMPITMSGSEGVLDRVPAGDYDVSAVPTSAIAGSLEMRVGRNDAPFVSAPLDAVRNPGRPFRLRLPVTLRTLNVRIEAGAADADTELTLKPVGVAAPVWRRGATHAARFNHARAFFFDEWAYAERDGFWTRANGAATVVIDTDDGTRLSGLPISITAGAVPTTIRLSVGSLDQAFSLAAGQKQDVVLPPADGGSWRLQIRSGAGFRPSEREPGSRDVRELAAWIAFP
jgi:hypothetical protein